MDSPSTAKPVKSNKKYRKGRSSKKSNITVEVSSSPDQGKTESGPVVKAKTKPAPASNDVVRPDPAPLVNAVKSEKPGARFEAPPPVSQLDINRPTLISPMGFGFTLLNVVEYIYYWIIPHLVRQGPSECRLFFSNKQNQILLVDVMRLLISCKICYALQSSDVRPVRCEVPNVSPEVLDRISIMCRSMPIVLVRVLEHIGKVNVDGQWWFPFWKVSSRKMPALMSFCPGLMDDDVIAYYMTNDLPSSFLKYRSTVAELYGSVIENNRFTVAARKLAVPINWTRDIEQWWGNARRSMVGIPSGMISIRTGEGESGQLVTADVVLAASKFGTYHSVVDIPPAMLTLGVAYGVGITPWVQPNTDRHQCAVHDALLVTAGSANEVRGYLTV